MAIEVRYNEKDRIIEAKISGEFNWPMMEELVSQLANCVNEKDCRLILVDGRELKMGLSISNIYLTPDKVEKAFGQFGVNVRQLRRAMVIKEFDRDLRFMETVSLNQSQTLRLFEDEATARTWLKE